MIPEDDGPRDADQTAAIDQTLDAQFVVNQFGETIAHLSTAPNGSAGEPEELNSIGRYEIRGLLGRGAFGAVYHGYDDQLHRRCTNWF